MPRTYQSQHAGSSRRAPRQPEPESEEDIGEQEYQQAVEEEEEAVATQSGSGMTEEQLDLAAAQLVRFALFHEYKRRPMNRGDMVKACFASQGRSFNSVMERARKMARKDFGMDIIELRAKYKPGDEVENGTQANGKGKKRAVIGEADGDANEEGEEAEETEARAKKSKAAGSKTYALRSKLPIELIAAISEPRRLPPLPRNDGEDEDELEDQAADKTDSGALLRLDKGDGTASGNMGLLGIRTLILCIILAYGRVVTDDHLHALLRRLNLRRETVLPYRSTDHKDPFLTLEKYMDLLTKQGYLEKLKLPLSVGQAPEEAKSEWRWGSRADLEFSEVASEEFIQRVFESTEQHQAPANGNEDEDEEGQQSRRRRRDDQARAEQLRVKRRERIHKDLASVAGSALTGEL